MPVAATPSIERANSARAGAQIPTQGGQFVRRQPRIRNMSAPKAASETRFLSTRRSRLGELARIAQIAREFVHGTWALHRTGPAVTVFGSARFGESSPYYP